MNTTYLKMTFWSLLALSLVVLLSNVGIGLIAGGIFIVPALILHVVVGLRISKLQDEISTVVYSAMNLLVFALIRPDGVHTINDNGMSAMFGSGYYSNYETYYFVGALMLLVLQLAVDIWLVKAAANVD